MKKIRRLTAAVLSLIFSMYAFSYEIYAEDNIASMAEDITWDIQNSLDISECAQGETVTLSVYLHGSDESKSQDIMVMSGILDYDKSLFKVEKADIRPVEDSKVQGLSFDASTGMFCVEYGSAIIVQDDSLLLQMQLHVVAGASTGKTTVCITNMEWSSSDSQQIVEVEHRVPVQLTIAKADTTFMPGDVNLDGKINLSDAKLVMQHYNGIKSLSSQQKKNADVNRDSKINLMDVKIIMRYYNGEISKF